MQDVRLILMGGEPEVVIPLGEGASTIGRGSPAAVVLDFPAVSREHARLVASTGRLTIEDLGSRNGTFVNGTPVGTGPRELHDGDEIVVGGVAALRVSLPGETVRAPRIGRLAGVWMEPGSPETWVDALLVTPGLSHAQHALLALVYGEPNRTFSRDEMVAAVWPEAAAEGVSDEAVDGVIKRLRRRLRETSPGADYLEVVRGHGVRLRRA